MTKQEAYRENRYQIPAPPVYTGNWEEEDWIRFIDANGRWLEEITDETQ